MQYVNFPIGELGAGIDSLSSENNIPEGYSARLENINPTPEGYLKTRPGYGSASGYIPLRIQSVEGDASTDKLCFYLDTGINVTAIDLSSVRSTPLIVKGKLSQTYGSGWDLTSTDSIHYYSGFSPEVKFTFSTGANSHIISGSSHGLGDRLFVKTSSSDNPLDTSNSQFIANEYRVTISTDDVQVDYTNSGPAFDGYIYLLSGASEAGIVFNQTGVWTGSLTITAATHQLTTFNIITALYEGNGTEWREVVPDSLTINTSTGQVDISSSAFTGGYTNYLIILRTVETGNIYSINVPANSTVNQNITLDGTSEFLVSNLFETSGTTNEMVFPDSVAISGNIATVTIVNSSGSAKLMQFNWEYTQLVTNKICVDNTSAATGDFTTTDCEVTIWGLKHGDIYTDEASRGGWITHIDTYRSEGEEYLVAGLGGTLYAPSSDSSSYLLGSLFPRLRNRISTSTVVGPAFGTSTGRSRGTISFTGDGEGYGIVTAINYQSGNTVRYTISTPNVSGSLSAISVTTNLEDYLTVSQTAYDMNTGTFKILARSFGSSILYVDVENTEINSSDFDEQNCAAKAGIFTDQLPLTSTNEYLPGDTLISTAISDADIITAVGGSSSILVVSGVYSYTSFVGSLLIAGKRTSNVIPLRTAGDVAGVTNFVKGDVVLISPTYERTPQITFINTLPNTSVSISLVAGVATISSASTEGLAMGQTVLLTQGGRFNGAHVITSIVDSSSFTVELDLSDGSGSAVLVGNTIEIYESLEWSDEAVGSVSVTVPSRWVPIEAPTDSYTATDDIHPKYFDAESYTDQPIMRSTMSADNMYFTNYEDEVYKYDGINLYRAGLPRWQPQAFLTVDTGASAKIEVNLASITAGGVSSQAGPVFTVSLGQELKFTAGDNVYIVDATPANGRSVTVTKVWDNGTNGFIKVAYGSGALPSYTAASTTITNEAYYRYYFRLNAVDANSNLIASATTGADDYKVKLSASAAIRMRIIGMPVWDIYDYDRIEVEIYRTKLGALAPFYKVTTLIVPFNTNDGYIDFTDTLSDDTLASFDAVATATVGAELGQGWSEPLRAKYITTSNNRLLLANIRDYEKLSITFRDVGNPAASDFNTKKILFRKSSSDTSSSTNNTDRMAYTWTTSSPTTVTGIALSSGTNYTVTAAGTYVTGEWVYLLRTTSASSIYTSFMGWHQIVAGGAGSFQITLSSASFTWAGANDVNGVVRAPTTTDIPVYLGTDYNYATLNGNDLTSVSIIYTALRRLSQAINASQRVCQTTGFVPWMLSNGGGEYGGSTVQVSVPRAVSTVLEVLLPGTIGGVDFFVNDLKRSASQEVSSEVQVFNNRVVVSYQNFPEIFDSPTAYSTDSTSAFDINPSDGQEITGIIPFFGESAFGSAAKDGVVVVFKTNSIYLLDLGGNTIDDTSVQKIDSRGLGCTAPYSIAPTQNGIMFANNSGIYRLKRDLTVEYIGRRMERIWQEEVNTSLTDIMTGHYYPKENQYKLSLPVVDEGEANSSAFVYNTVREYTADGYRAGSWTIFTNHPVVGWANTQETAFFGSTGGDVFEVYTYLSEKPYRDNGEAIEGTALLRSLNFGEPSLRKAIGHVFIDYRTSATVLQNVTLSSSIDNKEQFEDADMASINRFDTIDDGLGSTGPSLIRTIKYSIGRRKGVYFQLKLYSGEVDSGFEVAGVSLRVAGISERGIVQAKDT